MQFVLFSKNLIELPVEEAGRRVVQMGFDGLDLTVRAGGHVEPADARQLPLVVQALAGLGCSVPMITTSVTDANESYAADIFSAAADAGVPDLKLGYWRYERFGTLRPQLDSIRHQLDSLSRLAERSGVCANIHIHSGDFVSADATLVWTLLKDYRPGVLGVFVDAGHLFLEGGVGSWRLSLDLLAPHLRLVAAKSMGWKHAYSSVALQEVWQPQTVPLREGTVRWIEFFRCLEAIPFDGTVSVHSEYMGSYSWRDLSLDELLLQSAQDLAFVKHIRARAQDRTA